MASTPLFAYYLVVLYALMFVVHVVQWCIPLLELCFYLWRCSWCCCSLCALNTPLLVVCYYLVFCVFFLNVLFLILPLSTLFLCNLLLHLVMHVHTNLSHMYYCSIFYIFSPIYCVINISIVYFICAFHGVQWCFHFLCLCFCIWHYLCCYL